MKNISRFILASAALLTVAATTVHADPDGGAARSFSFTANDFESHGGPGRTRTRLRGNDLSTTVTVNPYLLVNAQLGGDWTVDGWGEGTFNSSDLANQSIDVWHSDPVTIRGEGWRNPKNHDTGRSIELTWNGQTKNAAGDVIIDVTDQRPVSDFNSTWTYYPDVAVDGVPATGGHASFNYNFQLHADASTYSGRYTIHPTEHFQLEIPSD